MEEESGKIQENDPEEMEGAKEPAHRRTLAAISITPAIIKLARRQITQLR